jgi:gliding motility-associated-like protein
MWQPNTWLSCDTCSSPVATPLQTTTYSVIVSNASNCTTIEYVTIDVDCNIFIPQAFSPNGDGQNDVLYVRGKCIKTMDFIIFDRWGNKVFESESQSVGWDGRDKGQPMNTGTYSFVLTGTLYDGSTIEKKGSVELVR